MLFLSFWGPSCSWHGYFQHQQLYSFTLHLRCINFTSTLTSITWRLPMRKKQIQTTMMYKWFWCVTNGLSIFNNALEKRIIPFCNRKEFIWFESIFSNEKTKLSGFQIIFNIVLKPPLYVHKFFIIFVWREIYLYCSIWCLRIYPFQLLSGKQNVRKPLIEELTNGPRNSIPSQKVT